MDEKKSPTQTEGSQPPVEGSGASPDGTQSLTQTEGSQPPADGTGSSPVGDPSKIGRYTILGRLGQGGFGRVYVAHDNDLDRQVAIKVPTPERITHPQDVEAFLTEARILARLDHPNIVPVFDVGHTDDGLCFVVSKLVEGSDLGVKIGQTRPSFRESAELVATIADALHYAHTRGLVHRDIKPANILIDALGKPCLADFGLALKDEDFGKGGGVAGTPAYMSPEQARGEGHRVDGRSDIFSLGVVFYELLTGRRPFRGDSLLEVMEQITSTEPRPPRQINDSIPKELERICQKALSKRASERYSTAKDMAEDLRIFLGSAAESVLPTVTPAPVSPQPVSTQEVTPVPSTPNSDADRRLLRIVPKGLRSFDEQDADFFLELLPGPRDRHGLPESIRFWKRKIEQMDPDLTFKVGLIYGPSGCGKSSLIKAGLLPRLGKHVLPVYVEATPEETEARLLKGLRKASPELAHTLGLVDSLANLRRGRILRPERKVLLVLDQFEQWLFAKRGEENTELVAALRHCDGQHVQAIVLMRDDFWLAASRFMRELEIRLLEGEDSALVDLFDPRHAKKVLTAFGQAYGALPESVSDVSSDHNSFLDQSIAGLAQDGKIVPVRLALFAEMVKGKPWTPATLKEVGGTEGIGLMFLEETFSASTAPPEHRFHQKAAQGVLKALIPESGTDIIGQMRSRRELLEASGYENHPSDFDDLIHILDSELRLITPTDPEGSGNGQPTTKPGERYYQLSHDYLVHSLRDWLTRKQRETRRGRAELRLVERSSLWNSTPENRFLPSFREWVNIRFMTRKKDWTGPQCRMMRRAGRVHGLRLVGALTLATCLNILGNRLIQRMSEANQETQARGLVQRLLDADTAQVPEIVRSISAYRRWTDPELKKAVGEAANTTRKKLHASLALLPVDATQVDYLFNRLLSASPSELPVLRDALKDHQSTLTPSLWTVLELAKPGDPCLLPTASALASYDPDNARWEAESGKVAQAFVSVNSLVFGTWLEALRPVRGQLAAPLATIFWEKSRPETVHSLATDILTDYGGDDPNLIANLLMDADPKAYSAFFPIAQRLESKILPLLQSEIAKKSTMLDGEKDLEMVKDRLAERQARAAVALVRMGKTGEILPLLRHSADPRLRSFIVNWLSPLGANPRTLVAELERLPPTAKPVPAEGQQFMDAVLFHPEISLRRALILALGTYGTEGLSLGEREPLINKLVDLYRNDPDAGIHGAAAWTLRQWKQEDKLKELDVQLMKRTAQGDRRWFVNSQGQTFAVIEGPVEFLMGSPPTEPDRIASNETPHRCIIPRRFAIAAQEVSVKQYQALMKEAIGVDQAQNDKFSPDQEGPMNQLSWYDAAAYCDWLSRKENLEECYELNGQGRYAEGMKIRPDGLRRSGYRLPTDAEWEYACRAGGGTSRYYGASRDLLNRYAWYIDSSPARALPCCMLLPNDLGLFDMLGNVNEWVQDRSNLSAEIQDEPAVADTVSHLHPRIYRGGTVDNRPATLRSANRFWGAPSNRYTDGGFRLARTLP